MTRAILLRLDLSWSFFQRKALRKLGWKRVRWASPSGRAATPTGRSRQGVSGIAGIPDAGRRG